MGSHVYGDHTIYMGVVKEMRRNESEEPLMFFQSELSTGRFMQTMRHTCLGCNRKPPAPIIFMLYPLAYTGSQTCFFRSDLERV